MTNLDRRTFLKSSVGASIVALAGCSGSESDSAPSDANSEILVERTLTPEADGNPAAITVDAAAGSLLELDLAYNEAVVFDLYHGDTGHSIATGGDGIVHEQVSRLESDPLPDSETANTLLIGMHPDERLDLTVTNVGSTDEPASPSQDAVRTQISQVAQSISADSATERAVELIGPLWLRLFDEKLSMVSGTVETTAVRNETLASAQQAVYGGATRNEAETWVGSSTETIVDASTSVITTAVSAKTGIPGVLIEGAVENQLMETLNGDRVNWEYSDPMPKSLDSSGGQVELIATLNVDMTVNNTGVTVAAPFDLTANINAEGIPAETSIDYEILTDQIEVELVNEDSHR